MKLTWSFIFVQSLVSLCLTQAGAGAGADVEIGRLEKIYASGAPLAIFYSMVDQAGFLEGTEQQKSTQCPIGIEQLAQNPAMKDFVYELQWLNLICAARDNRAMDFAATLGLLKSASDLRFREGDFSLEFLKAESKYFPKPDEFYTLWLNYLARPQVNLAEANKHLWTAYNKKWLQKADLAWLGDLMVKGAKGLHSMEESRYTHQRAGIDLKLWSYHECQVREACLPLYHEAQSQLRQIEAEKKIFLKLRNADLESIYFLPSLGLPWLQFQTGLIRALPFFNDGYAKRVIRSNLGGYFAKYWNWHMN